MPDATPQNDAVPEHRDEWVSYCPREGCECAPDLEDVVAEVGRLRNQAAGDRVSLREAHARNGRLRDTLMYIAAPGSDPYVGRRMAREALDA